MFGSRFIYLVLCTACAGWMTFGCGDDDGDDDVGTGDGDADGNTDSFVGTTYVSTTVTENDTPLALVDGTVLQLDFDADGNLGAHAGCNSMSGGYDLVGGILSVTEMGKTEMGCDPDLHAQDDWYAAFLQSSPAMTVKGDNLTLRSASDTGDVIEIVYLDEEVAAPDLALTDATWRVDTIIDGATAENMDWASPATIMFGMDGVLQFFTGCNQGSAGYVVEGNSLRLSDTVWTEVGCPDSDSQKLETAVLNVLAAEEPVTWEVDVDRLNLNVTGAGLGLAAQ